MSDEPGSIDDAGGVHSGAARVVAVLRAVTESEQGKSIRDIVDEVGTSRSAVHRLLQTLAAEGYTELSDEGRYVPGPQLVGLAARVFGVVPILRAAHSTMARLVGEVNETSYLAAYSRDESSASYIHRVESAHHVRHIQPLGRPIPLHAGAVGKAILSALPEDEWVDSVTFERYTEATPVSLEALRADIEDSRRRGFALSLGERVPGVIGVAAPILSDEIVVGGLTVAIPTSRVPDAGLDSVGETVRAYALELSSVMTAMGATAF